MTPEQIALALVNRFSWSSNVSRGGRPVGQQYVVAEAIAEAIKAERERCAEIAHTMGRIEVSGRRTNEKGRYASAALFRCRDKIRAE